MADSFDTTFRRATVRYGILATRGLDARRVYRIMRQRRPHDGGKTGIQSGGWVDGSGGRISGGCGVDFKRRSIDLLE